MLAFSQKRSIAVVSVAAFLALCLMYTLTGPSMETIRLKTGISSSAKGEDSWFGGLIKGSDKTETSSSKEEQTVDGATKGTQVIEPQHDTGSPPSPPGPERLAIVTFLSGTLDHDEDLEHDNYFVATRILIWQLLHSPPTRVHHDNIDVIVLVTPSVSKSRRERLEKDGATIRPIEFIYSDWLKGTDHDQRWDDLMGKFRAWEMTEYSRLLFLDGDMILRSPLDGIFDDAGAQFQKTRQADDYTKNKLPAKLAPAFPDQYVLSGIGETANDKHPFPPTWDNGLQRRGYFNAGFFMLSPNKKLFDYYVGIMNTPDAFDPMYMEQNLLNMVHHWDGPMPWKEISYTWNIKCVTDEDLDGGVVSLHEKWWKNPLSKSERAKTIFRRARWEMQGWYGAMDQQKEVN